MIKALSTGLRRLLYYFTPLYKGGSKVVVKVQYESTLKLIKVLPKVLKVLNKFSIKPSIV